MSYDCTTALQPGQQREALPLKRKERKRRKRKKAEGSGRGEVAAWQDEECEWPRAEGTHGLHARMGTGDPEGCSMAGREEREVGTDKNVTRLGSWFFH